MKRTWMAAMSALLAAFLLAGCGVSGQRPFSLVTAYGLVAILALLLLAGYCGLIKDRNKWILLLFCSVAVVNGGYFLLSASSSLEMALMANRISYLGSVFLPFSMLMTVLHVCGLPCKRWMTISLLVLCLLVFLVAASPGYLNIYYSAVSLRIENGVAFLVKEYGPWHSLYLFYLLLYMVSMIVCVIYAMAKRKIETPVQAILLCAAVFLNIGVWLLEQFVKFDFEMLALSYIISEVFLLGLYLMQQETERLLAAARETARREPAAALENPVATPLPDPELQERKAFMEAHLIQLTPTERTVYDLYLKGFSTQQILQQLHIKENTLKYHNRNIYSKLGVSSRKELLQLAALCEIKK